MWCLWAGAGDSLSAGAAAVSWASEDCVPGPPRPSSLAEWRADLVRALWSVCPIEGQGVVQRVCGKPRH
eukprot:2036453-Pyramimonas_sp.AAC.1